MQKKVLLALSVLSILPGCALDEGSEMGEMCPPVAFLGDAGYLVNRDGIPSNARGDAIVNGLYIKVDSNGNLVNEHGDLVSVTGEPTNTPVAFKGSLYRYTDFANSTKKLNYISLTYSDSQKYNVTQCTSESGCITEHFSRVPDYNACPNNYPICILNTGGEFSCMNSTDNPNKIVCDGEWINPQNDIRYCGAEGDCLDTRRGSRCNANEDCISGSCVEREIVCPTGQIKCAGKCIAPETDPNFCGAKGSCSGADVGMNCLNDGKICSNGQCVLPSCQGKQILCGDQCINPLTDNEYCGAKGTNNSCEDEGTRCIDGQVCASGKCVQNECKGNTPDLCVVNGQNICKNVKTDDSDHCGACNYKCSEHAIHNATSTVCSEGECQYSCSAGYINVERGETANTIKCIDPKTDNIYCGATGAEENQKGVSCQAGTVCVDGTCVQNTCNGDFPDLCVVNGDNVCKNVNADDPDHCGACNYKCSNHAIQNATSTTCSNGECEYICSAGYINVSTGKTSGTIQCINPKTDNSYCGATSPENKGEFCKSGSVCVNGKCMSNSCTDLKDTLCSIDGQIQCINTNLNNPAHCGTCNYRCSEHPIPNATSDICTYGKCQYTCNAGYVNVGYGNTPETIRCIDPRYDHNYCGASSPENIGETCRKGTVCVDGNCELNVCTEIGQTLCVVNGMNTCKNINSNDADHCGTCNYKCSAHAIPNATSTVCHGGQCQYECSTGYINIGTGNTADTINCINPKSDNNYCGANSVNKGKACPNGTVCIGGECEQNSCPDYSKTLCVVDGKNTCININSTDEKHCGTCNYRCSEHAIPNATSTACHAGQCQYKCNSGYVNVGPGNTANTINCIDPKSDNIYCGATSNSKGTSCKRGSVCVDGTCILNSCSDYTQTLCVVDGKNTCININSTDERHCGTCNYRCSEHAIPNATSTACHAGQCLYECSNGYINVSIGNTADTIKCIDPTSDNYYCGATLSMNNGTFCGPGSVCVNGECVINSCINQSETLCNLDGQNTCINISTDPNNCGACNYNCSNHPLYNAESYQCENGACIYRCKDGYVNIGYGNTMNAINCINPNNDNLYCGINIEMCTSGQKCINGQCTNIQSVGCPSSQPYECNDMCLSEEMLELMHLTPECECIVGTYDADGNPANGCEYGKVLRCPQNPEINCLNLPGWKSATCIEDRCTPTECYPGYELGTSDITGVSTCKFSWETAVSDTCSWIDWVYQVRQDGQILCCDAGEYDYAYCEESPFGDAISNFGTDGIDCYHDGRYICREAWQCYSPEESGCEHHF